MEKDKARFDERELEALIERLTGEKERHQQEKIARKIGAMKYEQTAERISSLLYSPDVYIRNLAIEILAFLGEKALPALKMKLNDGDRNIRKFSLDALKNIKTKQSCEIALGMLDDSDENVVEAALEVIAEQQYTEAAGTLVDMLKKTDSIWVLDALIRALAQLGVKGISEELDERILSLRATIVEKSILINTLVRSLGTIGSAFDIEKILYVYSVEYCLDDEDLIFGLSQLILNNNVHALPNRVVEKINRVFKAHRVYSNIDLTLLMIAASVKLQLNFFLEDIREIVLLHKGEEFFLETLLDHMCMLNDIPNAFVDRMLNSSEHELKLIGLHLIYKKKIGGFNDSVEALCQSSDSELSNLAITIVANLDIYKNIRLLEAFSEFNEEAALIAVKGISMPDERAADFLFGKLEHQSKLVRKAASEKLLSFTSDICVKRLEEIVKRSRGQEGTEALKVMLSIDRELAWKHINGRLDSRDDNVRAELADIIEGVEDSRFYSFMETMINDPSVAVRKKVIKNLCRRTEDRSLELLKTLFRDESDIANRKDIISNLHRFNCDNALDLTIEAAKDRNPLIRLAAVRSLGLFESERADHVMRKMVKDQVVEVREAAEEALRRAGVVK